MKIQKELVEKILVPKQVLSSKNVSKEVRTELIRILVSQGFSKNTAYVRLFRAGFHKWEIEGIDSLVDEFISRIKEEERISLKKIYEENPSLLYDSLPSKMAFLEFMRSNGMGCNTTAIRFPRYSFSEYERKGMRKILYESF